ncbi:NTP/NDP exchange transporter Tlc2 [Rickettsiales endosymbiont of Paramecium tredecaurelia]|nr:NTP/NDP exchange transporter Tlc2 [Candidatus Sarmatiella mevalonica]
MVKAKVRCSNNITQQNLEPLESTINVEHRQRFHNLRNSKFRYSVWPIRSHELKRFLPMAALMFIILLNQNLVRSIKDTSVVVQLGSEVLSFIKLWGEMPAGFLFVIAYAKLSNVMRAENIFRIVTSLFLFAFAFLCFVVFPNQQFFHPDPAFVEKYVQTLPHLRWFVIIAGKWSFALYYILAELWNVVVFILFFWQLANKITSSEEARRFYPFFSFFGQSNLLLSGSVIVYFAGNNHFLMPFFCDIYDPTEIVFKSLTMIVIISGICILLLHRFIEVTAIKNLKELPLKAIEDNQILKLTLLESAQVIIRSKCLWLIFVITTSYSLAIGFIEGLWMSKTKQLYTNCQDFITYQGHVLFWTGTCTLIAAFCGVSLMRLFSWRLVASITPICIMGAGLTFFVACLLQDHLQYFDFLYGLQPLAVIVFIGGLQNVLGKGVKYSLFDATKEMVYIPLPSEIKTKGKAAVDIVGAKVGKSFSSVVQFLIFTIVPSARHENIVWFLAVAFAVVCCGWIVAVYSLSKEHLSILRQQHDDINAVN